jgi:hypothetical protein
MRIILLILIKKRITAFIDILIFGANALPINFAELNSLI